MASFRSYVWDPILLVSQMITMQCLFYVSLGLWLYVIDSVMGLEKSIHQILDHVVRQVLGCVVFRCNSLVVTGDSRLQ